MKTHVRIDYEKLARSYQQNLLTVLRGFSVEPETEFLATWVPDQDDARSVIGLIEAARLGGLEELTVCIGPATSRTLDLPALVASAAEYGRAETSVAGDGVELRIVLAGLTPEIRPAVSSGAARSQPAPAPVRPRPSAEAAPSRVDDGVLPAGYGQVLDETVTGLTHEGALASESNAVLVQTTGAGATVAALIDPADHRVTTARHSGAQSDQQRKLLDLLCRGLEGRPIQEGHDHAVVRLEHGLRSRFGKRVNPGIVLPKNVSSAFGELQGFVDELLAGYRERQGVKTTANFYDPAPSPEWRALSATEQVARIQAAIDAHPGGKGLRVIRVEGLQRFVLGTIDAQTEVSGAQLLQLEAHVKNGVDPTLYFEMQPRLDDNKLRRLNDKGATAL